MIGNFKYHNISLFYLNRILIYDVWIANKVSPEAVAQRFSAKKGILRNFAKLIGKTILPETYLIRLQASGLRHATLFKKSLWHRCFPVNFTKFIRTSFLKEHLVAASVSRLNVQHNKLFFSVASKLRKCLFLKGVLFPLE